MCCGDDHNDNSAVEGDPHKFETYLTSRPQSLEINAIKMISEIAVKYERLVYF